MHAIPQTKFRIRSSYKANDVTMKAVYNIYNVPDVHYCNKYEIIVYTVHILYCQ
jgi:hypothetical protein